MRATSTQWYVLFPCGVQGDLLAWLLKAAVVADTAAVAEQQQQPAGTAGSSPGVATTSPASAPAGMACATWVGGGAAGAAQQAAGSNPAVRLKSSLTPLRHSGSTTRREQLQASTQPSRLSQSAAARSSALQPLKAAPPSAPAAALPGSERAAPRVRRRGPHATDEAAAMALLLGPAADVQLERLQQAARVAAAELHRILPNRFTLSPQAELLRAESQAVALLSERMEEEVSQGPGLTAFLLAQVPQHQGVASNAPPHQPTSPLCLHFCSHSTLLCGALLPPPTPPTGH